MKYKLTKLQSIKIFVYSSKNNRINNKKINMNQKIRT